MKTWRLVVTLLFILPVVIVSIHRWLLDKSYIFSKDDVAAFALSALEKNLTGTDSFDYIMEEMGRKYPGHIQPKENSKWVFINCGCWMGAARILHASVTEYVLLFGTAVHTSGHSGRYYANISDTILSGTFRQWQEGALTSEMYGPGDTVLHDWFDAAAVEWTPNTWMLEYGRGLIPSTLIFALADSIFSTTDMVGAGALIGQYISCLWLELNTSISQLFG